MNFYARASLNSVDLPGMTGRLKEKVDVVKPLAASDSLTKARSISKPLQCYLTAAWRAFPTALATS